MKMRSLFGLILVICVVLVVYWHTNVMITRVEGQGDKVARLGDDKDGSHNKQKFYSSKEHTEGNSRPYIPTGSESKSAFNSPNKLTNANQKTSSPPDTKDDQNEQDKKCPQNFARNLQRFSRFAKIRQEGAKPSQNNRTDYRVLILTPISDSMDQLMTYFTLLCSISYPHQLISVALGEDSSQDRTYEMSRSLASGLKDAFSDITVYKLEPRSDTWMREERHDKLRQFVRRRHLAMARNDLLMRAIREEHDYVIWLDSDVTYYPPDIIELMLSANKDVVVPVCLQPIPGSGYYSIFDKNTWRETNRSRQYIQDMSKNNDHFLMMEGYGPSKRIFLNNLRQEGRVVPIDGVGGCTLMVKATCHRQGLIFPPFILDSHIETEGFGKMATRMGIYMYGLPFVSVIHE